MFLGMQTLTIMKKIEFPNFTLEDKLTPEQLRLFDETGAIVFRNFLTPEKVSLYLSELSRIEKQWLDEGKEKINGIPLKFGKDDKGNKMIQRMCFLSLYSEPLHELLQDPRLKAVIEFLKPYDGRIAENEKDGLILNNYVRMPDSPRDLFLGQRILPMLNVGIHLDPCPFENGGLRILPGTHKQNMFKLLFGKKYFVDNNPDQREIGFDLNAGDLTVHDGRLWHRAQASPHYGEASRRRVMYVPVITGKYMPKTENSKTPFYHRFASKVQN